MDMNKLNDIFKARGLKQKDVVKHSRYERTSVYRHCRAETIPDNAAYRYSAIFSIPLEDLRPDLVPELGAKEPCEVVDECQN